MAKSNWFKRFERDVKKISPYIHMKKIKLGFWRIYFKNAYVHEVYEEMPEHGYDLDVYDPRLENQSYFEQFEDNAEFTRKIKNYVEGYWDSFRRLQTRVYLLKHNREHYERSERAY